MYDILTSLPYQKVMTNNINLDESFNSFETSIAKTLNSSSNTAFFYLKSAVSENEMNMAKVIYSLQKMDDKYQYYRDTYNLNFTHSKYVDLLQHAGQYCSIEGEARVLQYCPKCCNKSKYFE